MAERPDRYPGYDVLAKRDTLSWNAKTREVIDRRLSLRPDQHSFFDGPEFLTLRALCDRVVPQPKDRARPAPLAAMIDEKMARNDTDGYRDSRLPHMREAWKRGLAALEAEAKGRHGRSFHELSAPEQDGLLAAVQKGYPATDAWGGMPPDLFFHKRVLHDVVSAYYAWPDAWNEIGFGGPAAPRGYVRMNFDRRDPWEASEARPGREIRAREENARVG